MNSLEFCVIGSTVKYEHSKHYNNYYDNHVSSNEGRGVARGVSEPSGNPFLKVLLGKK